VRTKLGSTLTSTCSTNEEWNICGRLCELNCDNPHPNPKFCPGIVSGFDVRTKLGSLTSTCSTNEEWNICGQLCEPSCGNPHPNPRFCPRIVSIRSF
ncbi:unnamed protein product, partial [Heterotrigona itama]